MEKMKIEIWSDIACPYCYIGKHKLEKALAEFPHAGKVELVWHSYELNPSLPDTPLAISVHQYFAEMNNTTIEASKLSNRSVAVQAKKSGLDFDFDTLKVVNTSRALRLVKLAKENNLATETEEALFKAYFVDGQDVSDRATLLTIGTQIGLCANDISTMLDGDKYADEVIKDTKYCDEELKLEFIPYYLFNNKYIIQGSIAPEEYLATLEKAYTEWEKDGVANNRDTDIISGQSCSIDGVCS